MVNKNLTKVIEACENMPRCYQENIALGKDICANISFKEYIYFKYGFWPKHVDEHSFKNIKPSMKDPSCSTSLNKQGKEEIQRYFGSRKSKEEKDETLNPLTIIENGNDPLIYSIGQSEEEFHKEENKLLQGEF